MKYELKVGDSPVVLLPDGRVFGITHLMDGRTTVRVEVDREPLGGQNWVEEVRNGKAFSVQSCNFDHDASRDQVNLQRTYWTMWRPIPIEAAVTVVDTAVLSLRDYVNVYPVSNGRQKTLASVQRIVEGSGIMIDWPAAGNDSGSFVLDPAGNFIGFIARAGFPEFSGDTRPAGSYVVCLGHVTAQAPLPTPEPPAVVPLPVDPHSEVLKKAYDALVASTSNMETSFSAWIKSAQEFLTAQIK